MTVKTITLNLPETLYLQIQQFAQLWKKSTEHVFVDTVTTGLSLQKHVRLIFSKHVFVDTVTTGLSLLDDIPPEFVDEMSSLLILNDAALWKAACRTLPTEKHQRLDELLALQGMRMLGDVEQQELDALMHEFELITLTRAQSAVLLQQRGYDVSDPTIFTQNLEQYPFLVFN